jgi:GDP-L-fucose synthase
LDNEGYEDMKILIFGVNGFLGKNALEYFRNKGHSILGTYNKNLDKHTEKNGNDFVLFHSGDLTIKYNAENIIGEFQPDVILQFAAVTSGSKIITESPWVHVTDNVIMNSLIFKAAYQHKVKHVIFPSCTSMYTPNTTALSIEDEIINDVHPKYFGVAWTKLYLEKMCKFFACIKDNTTKFSAIRHSNIYGCFDKFNREDSHMFPALITRIICAPENSDVEVWGDGTETRDLLYSDDLFNFIEILINKQQNNFELINLGYGENYSINEIFELIALAVNKKVTMKHLLDKPTIGFNINLATFKAQTFGWRPKNSLLEGLTKTIAWYRERYGNL